MTIFAEGEKGQFFTVKTILTILVYNVKTHRVMSLLAGITEIYMKIFFFCTA